MSEECSECTLNEKGVKKLNCCSSSKSKVHVHRLTGAYLKVEDMNGCYSPFFKEMTEWPKIYFQTTNRESPFDNPNINYSEQYHDRKTNKLFLCELCMAYYTDTSMHIKSFHHKKIAENEENFVNLDRAISNGPSITDLMIGKQ